MDDVRHNVTIAHNKVTKLGEREALFLQILLGGKPISLRPAMPIAAA